MKSTNVRCYAAINKNTIQQMGSASGGIFPLLAESTLDNNGIVWGAEFTDTYYGVKHGYIETTEELSKLQRSKYVQSDMSDAYFGIKKQLSEGKKVLYSGTPCQTTGVSKYVPAKLQENLTLVDIVCHGVPTPMLWDLFINEVCQKTHHNVNDIIDINYKYKDKEKYTWNHPGIRFVWNNGDTWDSYMNETWYENGYLTNLYIRPSCYNCKMKDMNSSSDLTIGDFWGGRQILPDFVDQKGVSLIIVKTQKGQELFDSIKNKLKYHEISYENASQYNLRVKIPANRNLNRAKFWKGFDQKNKNHQDMEGLVDKYRDITFTQKVLSKAHLVTNTIMAEDGKAMYKDVLDNGKATVRNNADNVSNNPVPILYYRKEDCCGCSACYAVCPKNAIAMIPDKEGFWNPSIDAKECIRCGACIWVCPLKQQ